MNPEKLVRMQKVISRMGIASRRQAERMIKEGRITLNGKILTKLGAKINPHTDRLRIDGTLVRFIQSKKYIALNKPKGYLTTLSDEKNRLTVYSFLEKRVNKWLFPVGRLDFNSEGLLLFTNDG